MTGAVISSVPASPVNENLLSPLVAKEVSEPNV